MLGDASFGSIKPKTRISKIETLKEIIRAWGMSPEEILTKKALAEPHRTFISQQEQEQTAIQELRYVLKRAIIKELQSANPKNGINSRLEDGSPGEIRTPVSGSRARHA